MSAERKAIRKEIVDLKATLGERYAAEANKILDTEPNDTSARALQGGQWESNRRKF